MWYLWRTKINKNNYDIKDIFGPTFQTQRPTWIYPSVWREDSHIPRYPADPRPHPHHHRRQTHLKVYNQSTRSAN